jgi:hypothetical protein
VTKPNFLVIGAAKSGTTSLCAKLAQHPEIFVSNPKELNFFSHDENYLDKGWPWYERFFADAGDAKAVGEGTPLYTYHAVRPHAPERIAKDLPEARLIYMVRHPLERIESHWRQIVHNGQTDQEFEQALRSNPEYIDASKYWRQIEQYRKAFPDERILILYFEEFTRDPDAVLRTTFEFLGVDPNVRIPDAAEPVNSGSLHFRDGAVLAGLRKLPGFAPLFNAARSVAPKPIKQRLLRIVRSPLKKAQWSEELARWALDQVRDDVRAFLAFYGKPADYWDLDGAPKGRRSSFAAASD